MRVDRITRRDALQVLAAAPLAAAGACCTTSYPGRFTVAPPRAAGLAAAAAGPALGELRGALGLAARAAGTPGAAGADVSIVDPHAHFFNASDVPVKGFVEECIGHNAPEILQDLVRLAGQLAHLLAAFAPTAEDELKDMRDLIVPRAAALDAGAPRDQVRAQLRDDAARQAERDRDRVVSDIIKLFNDPKEKAGRKFEQEYLRLKAGASRAPAAPGVRTGATRVTEDDVRRVLSAAEQPASRGPGAPGRVPAPQSGAAPIDEQQVGADGADGMLAFLGYMLSMRRSNVQTYMNTFTLAPDAIGVRTVFGSLVDFDYWLDCPPRSSHDQQIAVHHMIAELYGDFFRPVVAYNPWTDIMQADASLTRVKEAKANGFVAVKIYPPTGFLPALNANGAPTSKPRPNLRDLDAKLGAFFDLCAASHFPIIAHTAHSNGRDSVHDNFGGPDGWTALLARYAADASPTIDFGHFGGGSGSDWTLKFAGIIKDHPKAPLFGDLGYWEELMCPGTKELPCESGQARLKQALELPVNDGADRIADRVMFATDWLMLSRVKRWADYPSALLASLQTIAPNDVAKIMGGNARKCFDLPTT